MKSPLHFARHSFHAVFLLIPPGAQATTLVKGVVLCGEGWSKEPSDRLDHRSVNHLTPSSKAAQKQTVPHRCEWGGELEGCLPAVFPAIPSVGPRPEIPAIPMDHRPSRQERRLDWRRAIGPFCESIWGEPTSYHVSELQAEKMSER
jgi:hypothetical protein